MAEVPDILRRICEQRRRRVPPGRGGALPAAAPGRRSRGTGPHARGVRTRPGDGSRAASGTPRLAADSPGRRFLEAIEVRRGRAVIAEIKMGSPRLGDLRGRFDPAAMAATYAAAGAGCLSVVVEPDHFFGSYGLLAECAAASGLPTVAKDFVVSDVQIAWARDAGASAVLLIAALHEAAELRRLAAVARGLDLVPLVETHDDDDFKKLRSSRGDEDGRVRGGGEDRDEPEKPEEPDWQLVGINNRDLRTFEVDLERSVDRVDRLPASALKVAESGIRTGADVAKLRDAGFDAFLVGERLVLSGDPAAALAELLGEPSSAPGSGASPGRCERGPDSSS